jgi:hypothetical protein
MRFYAILSAAAALTSGAGPSYDRGESSQLRRGSNGDINWDEFITREPRPIVVTDEEVEELMRQLGASAKRQRDHSRRSRSESQERTRRQRTDP